MKILLIGLEDSPSLSIPLLQETLGEKGFDCDFLHLPLEKDISNSKLNEVVLQIKNNFNDIELIGISLMTNTFHIFKKLSLKMLGSKLKTASETGAAYICNACTHCQIQYNFMVMEQELKKFQITPVLFTQILGKAMGLTKNELGIINTDLFNF